MALAWVGMAGRWAGGMSSMAWRGDGMACHSVSWRTEPFVGIAQPPDWPSLLSFHFPRAGSMCGPTKRLRRCWVRCKRHSCASQRSAWCTTGWRQPPCAPCARVVPCDFLPPLLC